jgi:hypothetical protein
MNGPTSIDKLMVLNAIALLKARRDRACDTKDWALYASLHAPDHVSENGDYGRWTSAAEMMLYVPKSMEHLTTLHQSHTPEITFDTATTARGIWAIEGLSFWRQHGEDHWFQAFGHYFETYAQRSGKWLFTSRLLKYYHTRQSKDAIFPPKIDE